MLCVFFIFGIYNEADFYNIYNICTNFDSRIFCKITQITVTIINIILILFGVILKFTINNYKKYHTINFHWLDSTRLFSFQKIHSFVLSTHEFWYGFLTFFFSLLNRYYRSSTIDAALDWCLRSSGSPLFSRKSIASISLRTRHDKPVHFPFGHRYFCTLAEHTDYFSMDISRSSFILPFLSDFFFSFSPSPSRIIFSEGWWKIIRRIEILNSILHCNKIAWWRLFDILENVI